MMDDLANLCGHLSLIEQEKVGIEIKMADVARYFLAWEVLPCGEINC